MRIFLLLCIAFFAVATPVLAQGEATVYLFGRDDCGICSKEKEYFADQSIPYEYLNVVESEEAALLFETIVEKHELAKITPLTIIGETVIQGFNGPDATGVRIAEAIEASKGSDIKTLEDHIAFASSQIVSAEAGCNELNEECGIVAPSQFMFDLPFVGVVDLKSFSLTTLSIVLGVIDGFNPCAMWVLVTFLVLLSQAGDRKRMIMLAGLFILAEAVMYNLILNVWYKTWDFIALDQVVTPLIGVLSLGGGFFFLYRWYTHRKTALVCDISGVEQQSRTIAKFKKIVNEPMTLATIGAVLLIAFSVNIIEFACSIGIPQAYTKILDLNMLTFLERQFYILIFTIGYMFDDLVVFGLAIWGFSKLEAHGHKYAQLALLIGGVLMVALGAILVYDRSLLVM